MNFSATGIVPAFELEVMLIGVCVCIGEKVVQVEIPVRDACD
jgi:hypothetical protein